MCVVSMVMDDWMHRHPAFPQQPSITWPTTVMPAEVTKEEFEELKAEMESLKKLLHAAKIYDEETGQPDCEIAEKMTMIKEYAESLGVDLEIE